MDRRQPVGGSEESQDHHEAGERVDAQGLPSWLLSSNICNWWFTGVCSALMSDSQLCCSVLMKTKALKRSCCLTSVLL